MGRHYPSVTVLVVGASGLVGSALMRALALDAVGTFHTRTAPGLRALDAADAKALSALISETRSDLVFFPAANPDVEWCEAHPDDAFAANVAPALAALEVARSAGARFVFFSSDYVFDGVAGPYDETAAPAPLSVYGHHKLEVESRVLSAGGTVVRTSTVYGPERPPGKNFVLRVIATLRSGTRLRVPSDQFSTPTWADDLARGACAVASRGGIWHVAGPDYLPRDRLAALVADVFDLDSSLVEPVATRDLGQLARRPLRGGLRTEKIRRECAVEFLAASEALGRFAATP
jgi:dTDP-4-dehydrorhamnose reductase